jgi:thymidylate kinase
LNAVRPRLWFGIDGIDATGKTTCIEVLRTEAELNGAGPALIFDEFTYSPVGETIRRTISEHRFLSLSYPPTTRWADTFLLVTDWSLKVEQAAQSHSSIFFSDRSHLSILGYQISRIDRQYGRQVADEALAIMASVFSCIQSSIVGVQFTNILLLVSASELQRRVTNRGEPPLTGDEVSFLMDAQAVMEALSPEYVIDVSNNSLDETFSHINKIVEIRGRRVE